MSTPTQPTRHLCGPKPAKYVPAHRTDIGRTFEVHRRLIAMQLAWQRSENNPACYPDDSECNEVDAAGTYTGDKS
jgi:hypothetical protein